MSSTVTDHEHRYAARRHGDTVVDGFRRLWLEQQLCDTRLRVGTRTFNAHRCFLAASSRYFHSMFTDGFRESAQQEVELRGVSAGGVSALLEYAYTGAVTISATSLADILEAADHLQFAEVQEFCAQYLKEEVTIENCLSFLRLAELYELSACRSDTMHFILLHFVPVSLQPDFNTISRTLLCALLGDDRLRATSELDVFRAALRWLKREEGGGGKEDGGDREAVAARVLGLVRFGLVDADQMHEVYTQPLMQSAACQPVLQAALGYHMKLFAQPALVAPLARMRDYCRCLLVLGAGFLDNTLSTHMIAARCTDNDADDADIGEFTVLGPRPDRQYFACVAVVSDFVYVVGGQSAMAGDGSNATGSVHRYNPRDGRWLQVASMTVPRTHFVLVTQPPHHLVAAGGKHNRTALDSAERYDLAANTWSTIAVLPNTVFSHAGCWHSAPDGGGSGGGSVYISGGCAGDDFTDALLSYDADADAWQRRAPMNQSRGYHVMASHGNRLLACAGNTDAGDRRDVLNAESYDVELDQWTVVTTHAATPPRGQSEAPAVLCGARLYILGGYSWDAHSFQDIVQCYNLDVDDWRPTDAVLPEAMTGVVACCVKLPSKMFERDI